MSRRLTLVSRTEGQHCGLACFAHEPMPWERAATRLDAFVDRVAP